MTAIQCCALVPTYDNPDTIRRVVETIRVHFQHVLVVDDGSAAPGRAACEAIEREGLASVLHLGANRGKGAAVKAGLVEARQRGFTHAFQIDADGQHDLSQVPKFIEAVEGSPESSVFGYPVFDDSVPSNRRIAREITCFWVGLEVGGRDVVRDAMVGFRIYPVAATLALEVPSNRMDFDVECAVRLVWAGIPIINLPVGVRYLTAEAGGISHFQPLRDNLRLSWLHTRLCTGASIRWCLDRLRGLSMSGRT